MNGNWQITVQIIIFNGSVYTVAFTAVGAASERKRPTAEKKLCPTLGRSNGRKAAELSIPFLLTPINGTTIIAGGKSDHINSSVYMPQAGIEPGLR